jgi:hypothetical protein
MKRKTMVLPLSTDTFTALIDQWGRIRSRRESALLYHYTRTDLWYRHQQLEKDWSVWDTKYGRETRPVLIDVVAEQIEEAEAVIRRVKDIPGEKTLLVAGGEKLFNERLDEVMGLLVDLAKQGRSVLLFCEINFYTNSHQLWLGRYRELLQNLVIWPLYPETGMDQFMDYLEAKWQVKVPEKVKKRVLKMAGRHMGLLKHLLRIWRDKGELSGNLVIDPGTQFKLREILANLGPEANVILDDIAGGRTGNQSDRQMAFLKQAGWLEGDNKLKLTVPILADWLAWNHREKHQVEIDPEGKLIYRGVSLNRQFSKLEQKAIVCLLCHRGTLVGRDELAQAIWSGKNGDYSDWSLDQVLFRARRKLISLLKHQPVKTVKKRGFVWE